MTGSLKAKGGSWSGLAEPAEIVGARGGICEDEIDRWGVIAGAVLAQPFDDVGLDGGSAGDWG